MKRFEDMSTDTGERRRNRRATTRGIVKLKILRENREVDVPAGDLLARVRELL